MHRLDSNGYLQNSSAKLGLLNAYQSLETTTAVRFITKIGFLNILRMQNFSKVESLT